LQDCCKYQEMSDQALTLSGTVQKLFLYLRHGHKRHQDQNSLARIQVRLQWPFHKVFWLLPDHGNHSNKYFPDYYNRVLCEGLFSPHLHRATFWNPRHDCEDRSSKKK